jgi:hypothetical protein
MELERLRSFSEAITTTTKRQFKRQQQMGRSAVRVAVVLLCVFGLWVIALVWIAVRPQ